MSEWTNRISIDEAAGFLRAAMAAGHLERRPSLILHDLSRMRRRIGSLKAAFPATALHTIAIKANPLVQVLRSAVVEGAGLEAASLEEVQLALAAQCPPNHVLFDSPAKTSEELNSALQLGIGINADNLTELRRIHELLSASRQQSHIGLRVNPQVGLGSIATTSVAGRDSKFGVPVSNRGEILKAFQKYHWLTGLHAHVGSQGCDPQLLIDSARCLCDLQQEINATFDQRRVVSLDIGGGLPVVYRSADRPIEIQTFADQLQRQVPQLFQPETRVITEFGRSIQAGCGVAFSRVEYVKEPATAVIHFGADLFLRWVYRPQDWSHELFVLNADGSRKHDLPVATTVVGPLCFGGDVLGRDLLLPPIEAGDWIGIRDVGAYTLSMWSRHCSRGIPLVMGHDAGSLSILRKAEEAADIVRFWS